MIDVNGQLTTTSPASASNLTLAPGCDAERDRRPAWDSLATPRGACRNQLRRRMRSSLVRDDRSRALAKPVNGPGALVFTS